jgi:hypothetical protein
MQRKPAIRLEVGGTLADKAHRAFVFEGHSYAFARQVALTEAAARRLPCNDHGHWPGAPSDSWRGCEADCPTRCPADEVERAFAELSRVAERLAGKRQSSLSTLPGDRDRVWRRRKRDRVAELGDVLRTGSAKLRRGVGILSRTLGSCGFRRRPAPNSTGDAA